MLLGQKKGVCREKVEGSRWCHCYGLVSWLLNEVPPWNVAFETTKRMLPLAFHPNQSSRAVLSIALIFVLSSSFCFSPWLYCHTPETSGQFPWSSLNKERSCCSGPHLGSLLLLDWVEGSLTQAPSPGTSQHCLWGCPKSTWKQENRHLTAGQALLSLPGADSVLSSRDERKECWSTGSNPILGAASDLLLVHWTLLGELQGWLWGHPGEWGVRFSSSGRHPCGEVIPVSLPWKIETWDVGIQGEAWSGAAHVPSISGQESLQCMFDTCWVSPFTLSVISLFSGAVKQFIWPLCCPILVLIVANPLHSHKGRSFHTGVGQERGVTQTGLHKHLTGVTFDWSFWLAHKNKTNWLNSTC